MKTYPARIDTLDLGRFGKAVFKQWLYTPSPPLITEVYVDSFARHIPRGSFAIDIGAFIGDTALPMALATGRDGLVLAFEPGPTSFQFLIDNIVLNGLTWVHPRQQAVSFEDALATFHYTDEGFINGGFTERNDAKSRGCGTPCACTVHTIRLPDYLQTFYSAWLPKLSFVKIDTEGRDNEILRAMFDFLAQHRPIIQVEAYQHSSDRERRELMQTVSALRYSWEGGEAAFLTRENRSTDVICTPL